MSATSKGAVNGPVDTAKALAAYADYLNLFEQTAASYAEGHHSDFASFARYAAFANGKFAELETAAKTAPDAFTGLVVRQLGARTVGIIQRTELAIKALEPKLTPLFTAISATNAELKALIANPKATSENFRALGERLLEILRAPTLLPPASIKEVSAHNEVIQKERMARFIKECGEVAQFVCDHFIAGSVIDPKIKGEFEALLARIHPDIAAKIYTKIWELAGKPNETDFGKNHAFDDMDRLLQAIVSFPEFRQDDGKVLKAMTVTLGTHVAANARGFFLSIWDYMASNPPAPPAALDARDARIFLVQFYHLPTELQARVYAGVWEKAGKPADDPHYGKNNMFKNPAELLAIIKALPEFPASALSAGPGFSAAQKAAFAAARTAVDAIKGETEADRQAKVNNLLSQNITDMGVLGQVYGKLYDKAGQPQTQDPDWAKTNAHLQVDNLLIVLQELAA